MALHTKADDAATYLKNHAAGRSGVAADTLSDGPSKLDPRQQRVRELVAKGDYQAALESLPADNRSLDVRNSQAVCLIRMHRFTDAVAILRTVILNLGLNSVHPDIPDYVRINFATALFYGGQPAGGIDVLAGVRSQDDEAAEMLRAAAKAWVSQMGIFRRLDWYMNRIAPKQGPAIPDYPLGRFTWEVTSR